MFAPETTAGTTVANLLVVGALVAMLIGAVLLIMARDHAPVLVPPGEEVVLLDHEARSWDPWGAALVVRVFGPADVTFTAQERTSGAEESARRVIDPGRVALVWGERAAPGEAWEIRAVNHGEEILAAAATATARGNLWVGGALVAFGLAGFVFHRLGMSRSP